MLDIVYRRTVETEVKITTSEISTFLLSDCQYRGLSMLSVLELGLGLVVDILTFLAL